MKMDQYYDSIGFERISQDRVTGLNDAGHQGLDGVYQNKGTNEYIVGEAKYNTSKLSTLKDGTKQMSKKWIGGKRLEEAVGTEKLISLVIIMNEICIILKEWKFEF